MTEPRPRPWTRHLNRAILALALLLLATVAAAYLAVRLSLPAHDGRVVVEGLGAPVRISRDAHAIPRIEAASPKDALFALGFVHAQDRLFQMDLHRRLATGRLAEIVGAAGLAHDRLIRSLGFAHLAEASLAHLGDGARSLIQAYTRGVNANLGTRRGPLPPEFLFLRYRPEPWTDADSVAWVRIMALQLSGNWHDELLRARLARRLTPEQLDDLWPPESDDSPVTLDGAALAEATRGIDLDGLAAALPPAPPAGLGSNAWVLAGARTASGGALLANDTHLALRSPSTWYLAFLDAPGLRVIGATMPGLPLVVLGRNERIAWGMTTTHSDTQDLFVERLDPADPERYLTPSGPAPFETRLETMRVRGAPDETLRVRATRNGPVVSDLAGAGEVAGADRVLALAWPGLAADDRTVEAGLGVMAAGDWESFQAALAHYVAPQQNIHYADVDGRIGFITPGRVPIRRAGDGRVPVPGWDGVHDWAGFVPFGELPRAVDPDDRRLFNANNRIVGDAYPHLIARDWPPSHRARRLQSLLSGGGHDIMRAQAMQRDEVSVVATDILPLLLATGPSSPRARHARDLLAGWDGTMAQDRPEPLLFTAWYQAVQRLIHADELGPLFREFRGQRAAFLERVLTERQVWCDDVGTAEVESCGARIVQALEEALDQLGGLYGSDMAGWRWGRAHRVRMPHDLFAFVPVLGRLTELGFASGGDGSTLNATHVTGRDPDRPFVSMVGPSYRSVVDLARPEESRFVAATGQSGHPFSRHYRDQTRLFALGRDLPMRMAPEHWRAETKAVLELLPARP